MNTPIRIRLTIPAVETYLQNEGWTKVTPPDSVKANPNVIIYRGGKDIEGKPLTVALPARSDLTGASRRVSEVVRFLATLEAKSPSQLALTIAFPASTVQGRRQQIVGMRGAARTTVNGTAKRVRQKYGIKAQNALKTSA